MARETARVALTLATRPVANGEAREFTANDLCGNVVTATQFVTATNLACRGEEANDAARGLTNDEHGL